MMKTKRMITASLLVIVVMLLSACSGVNAVVSGVPAVASNTGRQVALAAQPTLEPTPVPPVVVAQSGLLAAYQGTLETLYARVNPSVVNIRVVQQTTSSGNQLPNFPFGSPRNQAPQTPQYSQGLGSGFVWSKDGYIVSNNHVVDGADKIEVTFSDGTTVSAKRVGNDAASDLAVIKVDVPAERLIPVQMGNSRQVKVGQIAIAIGNPYGLDGTMTLGIISAVGRSLPAGADNSTGPVYSIPDVIQTDAPINPGNSGGVLLNADGQVIGVTAAIESSSGANAGIGFAIPAAIVQKVVPGLIKNGSYSHTYLGISGGTLTPDLATSMSLKADQRGVLVADVIKGSPADKAGMRASTNRVQIDGQSVNVGGDVILSINGAPVKTMNDLIAYLYNQTEVGQKVDLTILRGGKETSVQVTLEARPTTTASTTPSRRQQQAPDQATAPSAYIGIQGTTVTTAIAQEMSLARNQRGVLVQKVESGSPAEKAGLRGGDKSVSINGQTMMVGGDVITAYDKQSINTMEELRQQLAQAKAGQAVDLTVIRNGNTIQVTVTLAERPASQ